MKANPDKFQTIAVDNVQKMQISLLISCEEHVKRLGLTIDFMLNFHLNISNVCTKGIEIPKCV